MYKEHQALQKASLNVGNVMGSREHESNGTELPLYNDFLGFPSSFI